MEIIGCGKGHYYNPELYSSCPECAKEQGRGAAMGVTEPVEFARFGSFEEIGVTEPVNFDAFANSKNDIPNTEPVTDGFHNQMNPNGFADSFSGADSGKVQDYGPTLPVTPIDSVGSVPFMPVVGWLVCIDGAAKGRDYRIHSQYNYIGRGQHMDICISGDNCISTERAAVIAYDEEEKIFSFGPSMGHNVVRVNGKMLMNAVVLNAYDELTIGKTRLLFVPLCGERFDWNDK